MQNVQIQIILHMQNCTPFMLSVISKDSVSRQWRPWSDCMDAQTDLGLCCPHGTAQFIIILATADPHEAKQKICPDRLQFLYHLEDNKLRQFAHFKHYFQRKMKKKQQKNVKMLSAEIFTLCANYIFLLDYLECLTHLSLETPKRVIGKQCRPRSDAIE